MMDAHPANQSLSSVEIHHSILTNKTYTNIQINPFVLLHCSIHSKLTV